MHKECKAFDQVVSGYLYLDLSARLSMDPNEVFEKYTGRLVLSSRDVEYLVGRTEFRVVRLLGMMAQGENPFWVMDGEDGDVADFADLFAGSLDDWSDVVTKVFPEALIGDMAILDRLFVNPPFRGKKIGLHCIEMTTKILGGMGLFVLNALPLQYHKLYAEEAARETSNEKTDQKKLMAYYKLAGFRKLPGRGRMALDPRAANPSVPWEDGEGAVEFDRTEAMENYRLVRQEKSNEEY